MHVQTYGRIALRALGTRFSDIVQTDVWRIFRVTSVHHVSNVVSFERDGVDLHPSTLDMWSSCIYSWSRHARRFEQRGQRGYEPPREFQGGLCMAMDQSCARCSVAMDACDHARGGDGCASWSTTSFPWTWPWSPARTRHVQTGFHSGSNPNVERGRGRLIGRRTGTWGGSSHKHVDTHRRRRWAWRVARAVQACACVGARRVRSAYEAGPRGFSASEGTAACVVA